MRTLIFIGRHRLLLPVVMFLLLSCASSQYGTGVLQQAREKLGENVEFLYSPTEEFVVCIKRYPSPVSDPGKHVKFLLCDPANDIILLEDEQPNADIKWRNDYLLQVTFIPGIVREHEPPSGYVFDARNGQKTDLAQFNKAQQQ